MLASIANATNRLGLMTAVTCPIMCCHPAIIAQGTATLALRHLQAVRKYIDTGFDHTVLTQIGPEQDYFLEIFEKELAPTLHPKKKAA